MKPGKVIERGQLPDGTEYRIWESPKGKRIGYIGSAKQGKGRRRSVRWIRKQLRVK